MTESFEYNQNHDMANPRVTLATTASILALISVALLLSVYFAIIVGGIALVLAFLSRGKDGKFLPQAKRALVFGSIGVIGGYFLMIQAFVTVYTDPEARAMVNQYSQAISGESFDDMLNEIKQSLGVDFGDINNLSQ